MDTQTLRLASDTDADFLAHYNEHVFIFSSAGKPIFTRYGEESSLSSLFGLLQVLAQFQQRSLSSSAPTSASDPIRRITFGNPKRWVGSQEDPHSRDFYLYFSIQEELTCVLSTHNGNVSFCSGILEYVHRFMVSVAPRVNAQLRENPSYDARRLYSTADFDILRNLIDNLQSSFSFYLSAVPSLDTLYSSLGHTESDIHGLHAIRPLLFDLQKEADKERTANPRFILSLFLFKGRLLFSCVADGRSAGEITPSDVLLLMHFALSIRQRQQGGEIWVPLCLPGFNRQSYVWCYSGCPLDAQRSRRPSPIEHLRHTIPPSENSPGRVAPQGGDFDGRDWIKDLLFIQISASEDDFGRLSNRTSRVADILLNNKHQTVPRTASLSRVFCRASPHCLERYYIISSHYWSHSPARVKSTAGKGPSELCLSRLFLLSQDRMVWDLGSSPEDLRLIARAREEWSFLKAAGKVDIYQSTILPESNQPHQLHLFVVRTASRSVVLLSRPSASLLSQLCQYRVHSAVASLRGREWRPQNKSCQISELLPSFHFSNFVSGVESEVREVVALFAPHASVEMMLYWTVRLLYEWAIEIGKVKHIE